jgi:GT2 family glycosyltransferase
MEIGDRLSVVILTHNRAEEVTRTVGRMRALPERLPIVVVDNASADGTPFLLQRRFPEIRIIALSRNLGAAGRNAGVRAVATPYVAFCDDDTWWASGSLAHAVALLDAHPRLAVLSARVLVGPEGREDPACAAMAASPLPSVGLPGRSILGFLAGASVMRRSAFLGVGGYEPRFFLGGEEALLALDLAARGWALVYCDELTVHHHPSPYRHAVERRRLLARNALWIAWLRRPFVSAIRETLCVLRAARRQGMLAACCAEAARGLPWVLRNRRVVPAEVEAMRQQIEEGGY